MKRLAALVERLERTTAIGKKRAALAAYFREAPPADAAWGLHLLAGGRLKRLVPPRLLFPLAARLSGLPEWLLEESLHEVGDAAEWVSILGEERCARDSSGGPLSTWVEERLLGLQGLAEAEQLERLAAWTAEVTPGELFLLLKLLTGELRVGVSERMALQALAEVAGLPVEVVLGRFAGGWTPSAASYQALLAPQDDAAPRAPGQPYPFYLASPLEAPPASLGDTALWQLEWKWDGIRAQLVRRAGQVHLWSRGEERVQERFPEVVEAAAAFLADGTVLDGELLAWRGDAPLPFGALQRRIGRKALSKKILAEVPAALVAYDLLEEGGQDLRALPLAERRARLEALLAGAPPALRVSPVVAATTWDEAAARRAEARERGTEGLMLKSRAGAYRVGRPRGEWWKWKVDPWTVDAVLTHSMPGHGRRAALLTDHTFALWSGEALVTIAKAYSGLTDAEMVELDRWIRAHTKERHGPVREVEPSLVFELAFEGIRASTRHKAGLALRFPRIHRWRKDKPAAEADRVETLEALLAAEEARAGPPLPPAEPEPEPAPVARRERKGDPRQRRLFEG